MVKVRRTLAPTLLAVGLFVVGCSSHASSGSKAASSSSASASSSNPSSSTASSAANSAPASSLPTAKVTIGDIPGLEGSSIWAIAKDQGYWKKEGLEPNIKSFTNGPLEIQAMQTGDLDFAFVGNGAMWLVASGKAKVVAFGSMSAGDRVIAQPGITSIAQLKGKTVGVPEGTSGQVILDLALQKAGMSESDVKVVNMDPSTIVTAFESKRIDAAGIWYPLISTIKSKVPSLHELATDDEFSSTLAFPDEFIASNSMVSKQPDVVKRLIRVIQLANDYRYNNMNTAVQLTASYLQQPVGDLQAQVPTAKFYTTQQIVAYDKDGTALHWYQSLADYFKKSGKLQSVPDASTYYLSNLYDQVFAAGQ
jgi:NitT/TauT family transport system substrate-binding protein